MEWHSICEVSSYLLRYPNHRRTLLAPNSYHLLILLPKKASRAIDDKTNHKYISSRLIHTLQYRYGRGKDDTNIPDYIKRYRNLFIITPTTRQATKLTSFLTVPFSYTSLLLPRVGKYVVVILKESLRLCVIKPPTLVLIEPANYQRQDRE